MKTNYTFWVLGILSLIAVGAILFMQGNGVSGPSTATAADTPTDIRDMSVGSTSGYATTGTTYKPTVITTSFASVSSTTAVVVGDVTPQGSQTTYWFEFGKTLALGSRTDTLTAPGDFQKIGASAYITGLTPSTSYYFRLGAHNAYGTVYGAPYRFITAAK